MRQKVCKDWKREWTVGAVHSLFFGGLRQKGVCDFYMQDKDCRKNEISYIALLPVAPPLDEIDQRQKHQVRYNLIRMYAPFLQHTEPHAHTDTSTITYGFL